VLGVNILNNDENDEFIDYPVPRDYYENEEVVNLAGDYTDQLVARDYHENEEDISRDNTAKMENINYPIGETYYGSEEDLNLGADYIEQLEVRDYFESQHEAGKEHKDAQGDADHLGPYNNRDKSLSVSEEHAVDLPHYNEVERPSNVKRNDNQEPNTGTDTPSYPSNPKDDAPERVPLQSEEDFVITTSKQQKPIAASSLDHQNEGSDNSNNSQKRETRVSDTYIEWKGENDLEGTTEDKSLHDENLPEDLPHSSLTDSKPSDSLGVSDLLNVGSTKTVTETTPASPEIEKDTIKILEILHKFNQAKQPITTTVLPSPDLDKWLNEILSIASESEIINSALDIYEERKGQEENTAHKPNTHQRQHDKKYHLSKGHPVLSKGHPVLSKGHPVLSKGHPVLSKGHPVLSKGHPVFHVKGRKSFMTYKRQELAENSDTLARNNTSQANSTDYPLHQENKQIFKISSPLPSETFEFKVSDEAAVEKKIMEYMMNLSAYSPTEVPVARNETAIETLLSMPLPLSWFVIGMCITFSITCLCGLIAGVIIIKTGKNKFNADHWWNNMENDSRECLISARDVETGGGSKLETLYNLQGDQLRREVSKMINSAASNTTSASSKVSH